VTKKIKITDASAPRVPPSAVAKALGAEPIESKYPLHPAVSKARALADLKRKATGVPRLGDGASVEQYKAEIARLQAKVEQFNVLTRQYDEATAIIEWMLEALEGEQIDDFGQSFGPVQAAIERVAELEAERDEARAEATAKSARIVELTRELDRDQKR